MGEIFSNFLDGVPERFLAERKRLRLSQSDVGEKLGVDYKTIARIEKGSDLGVGKLGALEAIGFNIDYLLSGNTKKNRDVTGFSGVKEININCLDTDSKEKKRDVTDYQSGNFALIPLYDVEVSAGHGSFACEENVRTHLAFTRYSLQKRGLEPKMLACVNGKGDSMMPSIAPDDTLMIDMRNKTADGGIFVFRLGESYFVKRLVLEADAIRVISDNQIYPPWLINPGDDFDIIGKKVWQASWE